MDISKLLPSVRKLMIKKKWAINIANIDEAIVISLIKQKKIKRFSNPDCGKLLLDVTNFLA
jgi:hypothetical protein